MNKIRKKFNWCVVFYDYLVEEVPTISRLKCLFKCQRMPDFRSKHYRNLQAIIAFRIWSEDHHFFIAISSLTAGNSSESMRSKEVPSVLKRLTASEICFGASIMDLLALATVFTSSAIVW